LSIEDVNEELGYAEDDYSWLEVLDVGRNDFEAGIGFVENITKHINLLKIS
jgi:hypothetical protein